MKAPQCNTLDNDMRWISALRPLRSGKSHHPSFFFYYYYYISPVLLYTHQYQLCDWWEMNMFKSLVSQGWTVTYGSRFELEKVHVVKPLCCCGNSPQSQGDLPATLYTATTERLLDLCTHMHNKLTVSLSVSAMFNWCLVCVIIESQTEWTGAIWILSCPLFAKFSGLRC